MGRMGKEQAVFERFKQLQKVVFHGIKGLQ